MKTDVAKFQKKLAEDFEDDVAKFQKKLAEDFSDERDGESGVD